MIVLQEKFAKQLSNGYEGERGGKECEKGGMETLWMHFGSISKNLGNAPENLEKIAEEGVGMG